MTAGQVRRDATHLVRFKEVDVTTLTQARPQRQAPVRLVSAGIGLLAMGVASGLIWYGAYGGSHPQKNQEDAVPFLIVTAAVAAVVVFGLVVPLALRSVRERRSRGTTWALVLAIVATLTIIAFWSGAPVLIGAAGLLVAWEGRSMAVAAGARLRLFNVCLSLSAIAIAIPVIWTTILMNVFA